MAVSKQDVADQLVAMGYSEENVSSAQSKAVNSANINAVLELVKAEVKEDENEQEYCRRVIKEYENENGPLPPQRAPSFVRNWAMKHDEFKNNVPRHSYLKSLLGSDTLNVNDSLPCTDLALNPKFSNPAPDVSDQGSQGLSLPSSPLNSWPINPNAMMDDLLIEWVRDVLDEVNYEFTDNAKKFLYFRMGATGPKNKLLRERIDNIVVEIHRQRGVSVVEGPSQDPHGFVKKTPSVLTPDIEKPDIYDTSSFDYIDDTENSEIDDMRPMTYVENASKLQKSPEHQNIQNSFQQQMAKLLGDRTQKDLDIQASSYDCSFGTCPCVERIDLIMGTYSKLMNNEELWIGVPIAPLVTLKDRYLHQQLHDDFIHIKMYHIGRAFYKDHKSDPGIMEEKEVEEKEMESPEESENVRRKLCERFSHLYPCPDALTCRGFRRHYRERGNGAAEDLLFHNYDDNRVGARTRRMRNNKERTLQEECDKIHSYFLHSTKQLRRSTTFDQNARKMIHVGRTYSRSSAPQRAKTTDDEEWIDSINKVRGDPYEVLVEKMGVFRWQSASGFRTEQERGLSQLKPKYKNPREEALNNSFATISVDDWNHTLLKAKIFCQSFACKKIRTLYVGSYQDPVTGVAKEWQKGTIISLQEIVHLKLYTDFEKVQRELKKCLRSENINTMINKQDMGLNREKSEQQQRDELKQRLEEFFHWKSGLSIVLKKFGKKFRDQSKDWQLFHGINAKMILKPVETMAFQGPFSTTISKKVAEIFATDQGIVLEISTQFPRLDFCHAFDVSLISAYPDESEYLIGFVYLRVLALHTTPLMDGMMGDTIETNKWTKQHIASKIRDAFFALHLFQEQMYSMSEHLEYYLVQFLKCFMKHCCLKNTRGIDAKRQRKEIKNEGHYLLHKHQYKKKKYRYSFLSWLCTNIARHKDAVTAPSEWKDEKNRFSDEEWKTVMSILWKKFNDYRETPNLRQVIKIDRIGEKLKQFFLEEVRDKNGNPELDINGNPKYIVDFNKILKLFPNCREIHYFNQYRFDGVALQKLIDILESRKDRKSKKKFHLKSLRFLYYDFSEQDEEKDKETGLGIPPRGNTFFNPEDFELTEHDKKNMERLKKLGWKLKWNISMSENRSYGVRITISEKTLDYTTFKSGTNGKDSDESRQSASVLLKPGDIQDIGNDEIFRKNQGSSSKKPKSQWTKEECARWISSLGPEFEKYGSVFVNNDIDGTFLNSICDAWNAVPDD